MKAANLYLLTRLREQDFYTEYENVLSGRTEVLRVREHEFENLIHLAELLTRKGVTIGELEGFYYTYTIKQIGKEFDLLNILPNHSVLNIELKSQQVSEEKIEKQLLKNKYYLSCIAPCLKLFTYVDETGHFYTLEGEHLRFCTADELVRELRAFTEFESENIDALFCAKDYLISPLNMPEKFIQNRYFLTQQQETIKNEIMLQLADPKAPLYWGITGRDGTGKTLLLYDIAKTWGHRRRCCIIHCGAISSAHQMLHCLLENVDIVGETAVKKEVLCKYDFLFVDEAQRISDSRLDTIVETTGKKGIPCIFSYDYFQTLSKIEQRRNVPGKLNQLKDFQERKLSGRIRSNEEMSSFIRTLLNLNDTSGKSYRYQAVDVVFAQNAGEAETVIRYYCEEKDYTYIAYEKPQNAFGLDGRKKVYHAEEVIGQEFERVIITLDHRFRYNEEGKLQGKNHPNPDYIYDRVFFQGVSRTREKLCIVVIGNLDLFQHIIYIKFRNIRDER